MLSLVIIEPHVRVYQQGVSSRVMSSGTCIEIGNCRYKAEDSLELESTPMRSHAMLLNPDRQLSLYASKFSTRLSLKSFTFENDESQLSVKFSMILTNFETCSQQQE